MAVVVCPQSNGGSDRRVPLGDHWRGVVYQSARLLAFDGNRGADADHGDPSVPADGEALRGCDLRWPIPIS